MMMSNPVAYSPATVANYLLEKAASEGRALTPMQLIKLVYIAHGWHLAYLKGPLINERVQAWRYGPVIKSLYDSVKKYGNRAVSEPIPSSEFPWQPSHRIQEPSSTLLDSVWQSYGNFGGIQLSNMTHQPQTPWDKVWNEQGGSGRYFAEIDDSVIAEHYLKKISSTKNAETASE